MLPLAQSAPLECLCHFPEGVGLWSVLTTHWVPPHWVRSGQVAAVSCDCRSLTHPSRAAPHSSLFPPTTAPFQTLHLDVWGPSPVRGPRQERYFQIVVDDYSRYITFLWPQAFRYAAHQLNLWHSDARPGVTPLSLWIGSPSVAANYRIWGSLAHVRALGVNKLSPHTRACVFVGFPLDTSCWQFHDPITCVSHVTPQSSSPQRPVPVVSGGAGGAIAEGEGTGAAGASGAGSGGAGGLRVEATPEEDTSVSTQRPCPASPPGFPSVPQFPPRSPPRPVAAEPGGVLAGGTGVPGGVVGGGSGSGGAGPGDTSTATPMPHSVCFLTRVQRLYRLEREERERFERAR
ncbi:unnamed protein product [Closterium sp. NIES-53]